MIKVSVLGFGNVAHHLIGAFAKSDAIEIVQIYSRKKENASSLFDPEKITNDIGTLADADIYILAVSDSAIANLSAQLPFKNRLVVHTSGSVALDDLHDDNRKGVFYPLQTFSKNKTVDFSEIPICIEAQFAADYQLLEQLARAISEKTVAINTSQRKALHVAAVFVNNFTNHLYAIGSDICEENQVSFEILKPLIKETAEKVMTLTPEAAQTGPAKRIDSSTIETHLDFLSDTNQKKIYEILTQSIIEHGKKL